MSGRNASHQPIFRDRDCHVLGGSQPAALPRPHGEQEAVVEIDTLALLAGELSPKARALVVEWAYMHQEELRRNWNRARNGEPLEAIEPLD